MRNGPVSRIDLIGANGGDGEHYDKLCPVCHGTQIDPRPALSMPFGPDAMKCRTCRGTGLKEEPTGGAA